MTTRHPNPTSPPNPYPRPLYNPHPHQASWAWSSRRDSRTRQLQRTQQADPAEPVAVAAP